MLETMLALKNNDMRKIPGYDPEPVEKLRKLQRALVSTLIVTGLGLHVDRSPPWSGRLGGKCLACRQESEVRACGQPCAGRPWAISTPETEPVVLDSPAQQNHNRTFWCPWKKPIRTRGVQLVYLICTPWVFLPETQSGESLPFL